MTELRNYDFIESPDVVVKDVLSRLNLVQSNQSENKKFQEKLIRAGYTASHFGYMTKYSKDPRRS